MTLSFSNSIPNLFLFYRNKCIKSVESKDVQVSTLAFETDSEVQVDTLPHLERLTSRDAYGLELDAALKECDDNLKGLEKILDSSDGESSGKILTHNALVNKIYKSP